MQISFRLAATATLAALLCVSGMAQASHTVSGHWQGSVKMPGQSAQAPDLTVVVDLAKDQKGEWIGTFGMPDISVNDLPVSKLAVDQGSVRFVVSAPGAPSFNGKLSADGKSLSGTFANGPVTFKRTGEPKVKMPTANSALSKPFEGAWQGSFDAGGVTRLHLVLKLSRGADGSASGTLTSIDQGNAETPLTAVVQEGKSLQFELRALNGSYHGTINEAGTEIAGEWAQGGGKTPLKFVRGASLNSVNSTLSKAFEGTWRGTMDAGGEYKIELVLKLSRAADGSATGVLSNADAKSKDLPVSFIIQKDKSLQFEVGLLKATFHGTINAAGTAIAGTWSQEQLIDNMALTFKR